MGALSETQRTVLTGLVQRCGDAVLEGLRDGFPVEGQADGKIADLASLIETEWRGRRRRDIAFAPLSPMFAPREDGVAGLVFPVATRDRAWRAAAETEADLLPLLDGAGPVEGEWMTVADRLCVAAAAAIRRGEVWPEAARAEVIKRGARLDEDAPGSGLGLSIVDDLTRAYGGRLTLGDSDMGGLKVVLELPAAER